MLHGVSSRSLIGTSPHTYLSEDHMQWYRLHQSATPWSRVVIFVNNQPDAQLFFMYVYFYCASSWLFTKIITNIKHKDLMLPRWLNFVNRVCCHDTVRSGLWIPAFGRELLLRVLLWTEVSLKKSNETPTWCNTVQILFLQSHSTCLGRKRPSSGVFKTSTVATGACVIVAGQSSHLLIRAGRP